MRLAWKQTLTLLVCIVIIVGAHAWLRVQGVSENFAKDRQRDHHALGRGLGSAIAEVWRTDGEARAVNLVERANEKEGQVRIRWVEPDAGPASARRPLAPPEALEGLEPNLDAHWTDAQGSGRHYSYVAVRLADRTGALEISESLEEQRRVGRATFWRILLTAVILAGTSTVAVLGVGWWFVARPIERLIGLARSIGAGDLSGRIELTQNDELGQLAREMSAMSESLQRARKKLEAETEARLSAVSQLRHADRLSLIGTLSAGFAHELGTPLNVVGATARMIRTGEIPAGDVAAEADVIEQQAERMTGIVRQLLDFARPREPVTESTDLVGLARSTVRLMQSYARPRGVELVVDPPELPVVAEVDPAQIQQVVSNMVANAVQAMADGGQVRIALGLDAARREAWIEVADQGPGIPEELRARLFEPFFTTKEVGAGTGLGLSVAWGIVNEHGGRIDVGTTAEGGAKLTVWLPEVSRGDRT